MVPAKARGRRMKAALADGLLDLHLQHEVAAALEVESQFDAFGEVGPQLGKRGGENGQANDAIHAKQQQCQDRDELPLELGTHAGR